MRTIIPIPADTHAGSVYGLMRRGQWQKDDGGFHNPNPVQEAIWDQWVDCWKLVRQLRGRKDRLLIIHNGDAIEGYHHNTDEIVSKKLDEQERIHIDAMDWALKFVGFNRERDALYYVYGTETHNGTGAEDRIARDLKARPKIKGTPEHDYKDGRYTWDHLRLKVNGVLLDIAHHGPGAGNRYWTSGNTLRAMVRHIYIQCLDARMDVPRFWVRSHRHRWINPEIHRGQQGEIEGVLTPSFQYKTKYGHRVGNAELLTSIGMFIAVVEDDGRCEWHCPRLEVGEPVTEVFR